MIVVRLRDVHKSFRRVGPVLNGVSFDFESGKIYGLVGPNGSGKSVLFRLMCRFLDPDSGTVRIDPAFLDSRRTYPKNFGVLIDRPGYLANRTGLENLMSLARIQNRVAEEHVANVMEALGLDPSSSTRVGRYSLGMKQKLSLAQAVMEDQSVLILDEPFNALDEESVVAVRRLIQQHMARGSMVIFSSHNSADMQALADEVLILENGRLRTRLES